MKAIFFLFLVALQFENDSFCFNLCYLLHLIVILPLQDSAFFEIPINGKYVSQIGLYLKRPCSVFVNSLISYGSIEKPLRARTKKN